MSDTNATRAAPDRYRAPALDKGLDILELLATEAGGLTRAEIVRAMGRSQSEIYRMLERLVARGYVCRSREGDRYALSMKLFLLVNEHPPLRRLVAQSQALMDNFARTTQQSLHLVVHEGPVAIVVAQASPPSNWEFRLRVGAQLDLLTTSSGETLLAFQDRARCVEMLAQAQSDMSQQDPALWSRLETIRATGHRSAPSRQLVGVRDMSVPILGPDGNAFAVLTCPYVKHVNPLHEPSRDVAACLAQLKDLAAELALR
ncbi:MAG: IclR family transcriptional regulator [Natronohydrobacter sp.]|nr:IclR family transcriptional regulator [Natronohydrobacter sp.]